MYVNITYLYKLSGRTGSALVWHTRGSVSEPPVAAASLRFEGRVYTLQYVELREYIAHEGGGATSQFDHHLLRHCQSLSWSTASRSTLLGYFS